MKFIKKFNEGVIAPHNFDKELEEMKLLKREDITVKNINDIFNNSEVQFISVDYFIKNLKTDKEIERVPVNMPNLMGGVRWGAHNIHTNKMYICVDENRFIEYLKSSISKKDFYKFLDEVLRHESIHYQQAERRPNVKIRNLENSPADDRDKYFGSSDEMMAYADSYIVGRRNNGLSNEQILDELRNKKSVRGLRDLYKSMSPVIWKQFTKYVYQYLTK